MFGFGKKPVVKPGQILVTKKNALLVIAQQLGIIISLLKQLGEKETKKGKSK